MLLIFPPLAKPCEPPAGIARLAGVLRGHGQACTLWDANLEGILSLLDRQPAATDTWSKRAWKNCRGNLDALRTPELYANPARYRRAVADINRVLEQRGRERGLELSLANYQDPDISPLHSADLLRCAEQPETNIFFPFFARRLPQLLEASRPRLAGFSLNYLSQAPTTFAIIGLLRRIEPSLPIVLGGGLVTSWLRNLSWRNPFAGLIDHLVAGPGEDPLLQLLGQSGNGQNHAPDYRDLPLTGYLAPGLILPYAASSGCYWNRCSFCPEKAENNPYHRLPPDQVIMELETLRRHNQPALIHFLDNAVSPELMQSLTDSPPGAPWYGFARVGSRLADPDFCLRLRRSGCRMLKLGIESGDQGVLDAMDKGIDLQLVHQTLGSLAGAGIATYVYLLFGTPAEGLAQARKTLDFVIAHREVISCLNLAIFNMPLASAEARTPPTGHFSAGDLSLYCDFVHPLGWGRREIRTFLDREFKRHPAVQPILQRDPPLFTSNHAPFFELLPAS